MRVKNTTKLFVILFSDGLNENAERFVPNFFISFTALTIFCVSCSFTLRKNKDGRSVDLIRSKPYLACAGEAGGQKTDDYSRQQFLGLLNTLLSLISAFGLLMLIGGKLFYLAFFLLYLSHLQFHTT